MVPSQATSSGQTSSIMDDLDDLWGNRSIVDEVKMTAKKRKQVAEARSGNSKQIVLIMFILLLYILLYINVILYYNSSVPLFFMPGTSQNLPIQFCQPNETRAAMCVS